MKALKKTCTTVLMLLTIVAAYAHQSNIVGFGTEPPYEITTVRVYKASSNITLQYVASSNNANDLVLKTGNLSTAGLMYFVQDAEGLVMKSNRIGSNEIAINLEDLAAGTYFLIVSNDDSSKTFKVIKRSESNGVVTMSK